MRNVNLILSPFKAPLYLIVICRYQNANIATSLQVHSGLSFVILRQYGYLLNLCCYVPYLTVISIMLIKVRKFQADWIINSVPLFNSQMDFHIICLRFLYKAWIKMNIYFSIIICRHVLDKISSYTNSSWLKFYKNSSNTF